MQQCDYEIFDNALREIIRLLAENERLRSDIKYLRDLPLAGFNNTAQVARLRSVMGAARKYIVTHGPAQGGDGAIKKHLLDKIDVALSVVDRPVARDE